MEHLTNIGDYDATHTKIILNPIFSKRLSLEVNTTELIGNFDWEYITENHMRKDNIKRA
jgi:hypothetical protein